MPCGPSWPVLGRPLPLPFLPRVRLHNLIVVIFRAVSSCHAFCAKKAIRTEIQKFNALSKFQIVDPHSKRFLAMAEVIRFCVRVEFFLALTVRYSLLAYCNV